MLVPMRTMPLELASSVEVNSTARAHLRQRNTSTETTTGAWSMLSRTELEAEDTSESDAE